MTRFFIMLISVLMLAACGGQGGYAPQAPEAAGAAAQVTLTAVSYRMNETAVSYAATTAAGATQQAAIFQATANSAQATRAAVYAQETAVSQQATATTQAAQTATVAHEIAVGASDLQITRNAADVSLNQTRAAAIPTAAAIQLQMVRNAARVEREAEWSVIFRRTFSGIMVVVLLSSLFAAFRLFNPVRPVWDDDGRVLAVAPQYQLTADGKNRRPTTIINEVVPPPVDNMKPRTYKVNGELQDRKHRQMETVDYAGQSFRFTGMQLDKMEKWVKDGDFSIRRDKSQAGPDVRSIGIFGDGYTTACIVMVGREYWDDSGKCPVWTALGLHEVLGMAATPPTPADT